jgi:hypothetical protein
MINADDCKVQIAKCKGQIEEAAVDYTHLQSNLHLSLCNLQSGCHPQGSAANSAGWMALAGWH